MIFIQIMPIVIIALAIWSFVYVVGSVLTRLSGWNRVYEMIGKRYGAQIRPGRILKRPTLSFMYGRSACRLHNSKGTLFPSPRQTELSMTWLDPGLRLEITTQPSPLDITETTSKRKFRFPRLKRKAATQPLVISDAPFKENLTIRTNEVDQAKILLSPGVQWQLEQLRRHIGDNQLHVSLRRGKLTVSKPTWIKHHQLLDDFVRFGLELYDQMLLTNCHGIEFVNENQLAVIEKVVCPICSEQVSEHLVVCVRCKTPHCLDCWQYNGQCATFACNETRFVRAANDSSNVANG